MGFQCGQVPYPLISRYILVSQRHNKAEFLFMGFIPQAIEARLFFKSFHRKDVRMGYVCVDICLLSGAGLPGRQNRECGTAPSF
jgi:hypothetical protein